MQVDSKSIFRSSWDYLLSTPCPDFSLFDASPMVHNIVQDPSPVDVHLLLFINMLTNQTACCELI